MPRRNQARQYLVATRRPNRAAPLSWNMSSHIVQEYRTTEDRADIILILHGI